jgi:hypothetical protein
MHINDFSLTIQPSIRETAEGHVTMQHGTQYAVSMRNNGPRPCDAEVSIDGMDIGTFRLLGHTSLRLERSPADNGCFTFYASGTSEAAQAGEANVDRSQKGLVAVRFVPERYSVPAVKSPNLITWRQDELGVANSNEQPVSYGARGMSGAGGQSAGASAGITGLSGHSNQGFQTVGGINRDETAAVTITLRLIADGVPQSEPRPLPGRKGNRIPEAIG